jgi:hypothetical protein
MQKILIYTTLGIIITRLYELLFVKDGSDRWIVGLQVLNDPNFAEIHDQLNELERIEYTPFPPEIDETTNNL